MQTLFDTIIIPEADREQLRREARERFPPRVERPLKPNLGTLEWHGGVAASLVVPIKRRADRSRRDDLRHLIMIRPTYDPNKQIQFELIAGHALIPPRDGSPSLTGSPQTNQKKPPFPPVGASFLPEA